MIKICIAFIHNISYISSHEAAYLPVEIQCQQRLQCVPGIGALAKVGLGGFLRGLLPQGRMTHDASGD